MNIDEAIVAMENGKEVTHECLRNTATKSLRYVNGAFIDKEGYILNPFSVYLTLISARFNEGWEIINEKET